jgi:hypothetical protein
VTFRRTTCKCYVLDLDDIVSSKFILSWVNIHVNVTAIMETTFFLFAFIEFNPCFTIWVYHGVFTEMFPVCCLQSCLQLITCYHYFLVYRSVIWTVLGVLPNLISLGIVLKCLEDTSEEACDADGVDVVLQNQRLGESFENWWALFRQ